MSRLILIDSAPIPGGGEMRLLQDGEHYSIKVVGAGDLMSTRTHGSEDQLGDLTCAPLARKSDARVLIGGLGMGFTLAAALRHLDTNAEVVIAELVPAVVSWNRGPLGAHAGFPLRDSRSQVRETDVAALIRASRESFDAILLDVDNGPEGLTHSRNGWLYTASGLAAIRSALRPAGVLAVWSAGPNADFTRRLQQCGYSVDERTVRAHANRGARHRIWLAMRPVAAKGG
ncbi:MAG: hypothetical protein ABI411_06275 [Tahibacter sp.]